MKYENQPQESTSIKYSLITKESVKLIVAFVWLIILLTQGSFDPTAYNPMWPDNGIQNWLSLFGSLQAGFFLENFGYLSFLIPISILCLSFRDSYKWWVKFFWSLFFLGAFFLLVGLFFPSPNLTLARYGGVWGVSGHIALTGFPGRYLAIFILILCLFLTPRYLTLNRFFFQCLETIGVLVYSTLQYRLKKLKLIGMKQVPRINNKIKIAKKHWFPEQKAYFLLRWRKTGDFWKTFRERQLRKKIHKGLNRETQLKTVNTSQEPATTNHIFEKSPTSLFQQALAEYEKEFMTQDILSSQMEENMFEDIVEEEKEMFFHQKTGKINS